MASSRTGYLAVKAETTKAVAVKPTNFLPFKSGGINFKPEIIKNNPVVRDEKQFEKNGENN